jgi:DNA polymerase III delta subunit
MYICGEKILVNEVYKKELESRKCEALNFVVMDGSDKVPDLHATLNQFSTKSEDRLVVIKNADKISNWDFVIEWTKSRYMRYTSLICVGNETKPQTKEDKYRPFIEKGRFVDCKALKQEQILEMISHTGKFSSGAATALYESCSGDLGKIINEINKFNYLDGEITKNIVLSHVVSEHTDIIYALFEKGERLQVAKSINEKNIALLIGTIEYNLNGMLSIIRHRNKQLNFRDLAEITNIPIFLVGKFFYWSKAVTQETVFKRLKLLANLDVSYRKGNLVGAVERFLMMW